jgi:putative tryptophan/tyrosine transport system substrate-binding protein
VRTRDVSAAPPRVGVLTDSIPLAAILQQGLTDAGWEAGEDVTVMRRGAAADGWRSTALALAASRVSVIVAGDHAAMAAAREASSVIPIVAIDFERDPVAGGFVKSLARPGGNVTGLFCDFGDAMAQVARALRDAVPDSRQMIALTDGDATEAQVRALRGLRDTLGLGVDTLDLGVAPGNALIDRIAASRGVLLVLASSRLQADAARLAKRAMLRRLPSAGAFVRYAQAGGLLARGPSLADAFRRAAVTVDRLLRGAHAAEIAVERPPRFELVINAKTAATLDIALPPNLLSNADHIIR